MAVSYEQYQKKNGKKLWRFKVQYSNPETKKRIATTRSGFETKKSAKMAYEKLTSEVNSGESTLLKDYVHSPKTFNGLFEMWWDTHSPSLTPSSQRTTRSIFDNHILPYIGNIKLDHLSSAVLQSWINDQSKRYATYARYATYLKSVLNYGVAIDALQRNPFNKVIMPPKPRKSKPTEVKAWDADTFKLWIHSLQEYKKFNIRGFTYLWLLSFTGIRLGEGLALKWSDLDWESGTLHIQRTLAMSSESGDERFYLDSPKTSSSDRILHLDNTTLTVLNDWFNVLGKGYDFIFPKDRHDNRPLTPFTPRFWLHQVEKMAGIHHDKGGLHILRHTFATLAIENGFTPSQVQYQLGHATSQITMDIYAHATRTSIANLGTTFANKLEL